MDPDSPYEIFVRELIAKDGNDYVAISSRLLSDEAFYQEMRAKIAERKERLFHFLFCRLSLP